MSAPKAKQNIGQNRKRGLTLIAAIIALIFLVVLSILSFMNNEFVGKILPYGLIIAVILLTAQVLFMMRFFRSINIINDNATLLSQGKLNISDIMADKTKGLETLTVAFNDMKRNLLSFIEATKSNVIILSDAVDKVTKSLDMSYKGNEQIASNMAIVAEKAQDQLQIVKDTLANIEEVNSRAERITSALANIEQFVENTVKITNDGSSHLDKYNEQIEVINSNLNATSTFIETLNTHLNEIDQVGGLIINITEQLKLLSLNSAVEAARAGEAGKGFIVVAQEMNKLSTATRDSIGQINKLLTNIMNSNEKVSESIGNVSESFNISQEIFNSVKQSFYTINKNANILNEDMKKVYEESRMITKNTKDISEQGAILHDASSEISNITQDVAAVTEEELAENEEINNQALSLQNMLSSIENLLRRFKTSVTPVDKVSEKHLKIVMLSPLDHPFWRSVRQGALYAQNELKSKNVDVEYIGFENMTDDSFINTLDEKIKQGCDGLVLPGFINEIETYVEKANRKNIPVMAFNCDFPEGTKRLSYFGPDVFGIANMAGQIMAKGINEEGEVAIFRGNIVNNAMNKVRRDAVVNQLKKHKKISIVAELDEAVDNDLVYTRMKELIKEYPNLKAAIITSGGIIGAAKAVEEAHKVGQIQLFCFDYDDDVINLIKKGIVNTSMGQDPFGQGHDPIIYLYNYLVANEVPESITHTRIEVMDIRNCADR